MPQMPPGAAFDDDRFVACLDLVGRTGAVGVDVRWSDDEEPTIWMVVARYRNGAEVGAGLDPLVAATRLLETMIDGVGRCGHCGRPTGVTFERQREQPQPLEAGEGVTICWFVYDPETKKFRRSCEGETVGRAYGLNPQTGEYVGRNDPCPCGSGKKWKKCHGAG